MFSFFGYNYLSFLSRFVLWSLDLCRCSSVFIQLGSSRLRTVYRIGLTVAYTVLLGVVEARTEQLVVPRMYGHTRSKGMDQPGKVASPARGQLNRKHEYFPVHVRA